MTRPQTVFAEALGDAFDGLPPALKAAHADGAELVLQGRADVTRGAGGWPRVLAWLFRFPPAGRDVPVRVEKLRGVAGELWKRDFGGARFRSYLECDAKGVTERLGLVTFRLNLDADEGGIAITVRSARIGPVPLPHLLLPRSDSRESVDGDRFRFDIAVHAPLTGGLIVRYSGWLSPV